MPLLVACLYPVWGCSVESPSHEGRPCETDEQCGGGTRCDPTSKTCRTPGAAEAGADLPVQKDGKPPGPDMLLPDTRSPDQLKVPDAGCPSGYTQCGSVCVDLDRDPKHCGACNNACPKAEGDTCIGSKCHCGKGPVCTNGLTCVAKICRCVAGGLCKGCCDGDVCRQPPTLTALKCGAGGNKCFSCLDKNPCTADTCSPTGKCTYPFKPGVACDDKDACTSNDKCTAGKCAGTKKSCSDGLSCTSDSCDKLKGGCLNKVQPNYCAINKVCYKSGAKPTSSSCLSCVPFQSPSSWTAAKGCVATLAGTGQMGCVNGLASTASFFGPLGMAVDASGRIYVAETSNHVIRTIYKGKVSMFAGTCKKSGSADGPAATATFKGPQDVAVDSAGNVYVADEGNYRVRKISGGKVTTVAGSVKGFANGFGKMAKFSSIQGIVSTPSGTLFVVDTTNNRVRRIVAGGAVSTYAGSGASGSKDGPLLQATFNWPHTISMDSAGNLYLGEVYWIRKISSTKVSTLIKPTAGCAGLGSVQGTVPDKLGKLYIADYQNHRIRVYAGGSLTTLTGTCGTKGSTNGLLSKALFNYPNGLVLWGGKLYVSDYMNHRIRVITLP